MNTLSHAGNPPKDIEGFERLTELALDMRWSWNHATDEIWRQLDPVLWDLTHHPCDVLQAVSREKVDAVLADPTFRQKIDALVQSKKQAAEAPAWFQQTHAQAPLTCVAYFSMEFMLSEALPIYSGGLGNVAGDQLKAASDLGVPVVGVGLLYQQGYFRQVIDKYGAQQALYTEQHYLPAATAYRRRSADKSAIGRQMAAWQHSLESKWSSLHFGEMKVQPRGDQHAFEVQVFLGDLDPNAVLVELYADGVNGGSPVRQEMKRVRQLDGASGGHVYSAAVSAVRPATDYTARVIPHCDGVAIPLEDARIFWQQ